MLILSIDVGIRNLAYIIIKVNALDKHEILRWDVIELCDKDEKASKVDNTKIGKNMHIKLDDILEGYNIDKF